MQELGKMEDKIFKDRQNRELEFRARNKAKRRRERMESDRQPKWVPQGQFAPQALGGRGPVDAVTNAKEEAYNMRREGMAANRDAAKSMKALLRAGQGMD